MTVREFFASAFQEIKYNLDKLIAEVFQVVNVNLPLERKLREFSGGQQARLLLAFALIQQPDILLLDEPTNNLDKAGIEHLTGFLMLYEKTCIVISHDAEFLNAFTDGVLPEGFGGTIVYKKSSCNECNVIINRFETRIMRGHYNTLRKLLGTGSKHNKHIPKPLGVKITKNDGKIIDAQIPIEKMPIQLFYTLYRPEILDMEIDALNKPYAKGVGQVLIQKQPYEFKLPDGRNYFLLRTDKVKYPVSLDSHDIFRLLAKIAHSYALKVYGKEAFRELYLTGIILGDMNDSMKYIGNASELIQGLRLRQANKFHSIKIHRDKGYITVLIQLFNVPVFSDMPIYQVVVGRLKN
jgi:energy-coupling factor transporter ATP-binding protein EcfA2